jgi:Site-specific recombinase XerD
VNLLKTEKRIKEIYTDHELNLLLKKPNINNCGFCEYRSWVISNYLLATGNRISTICNILIEDINFEDETIILRKTKNRKQSSIPLSHSLILILNEYLKYRKGVSEDYLFCNQYGKQLATKALESSLNSYNKKRGVMKTSAHLYRNTFAKKWLLKGR